MSFYPGVYGTMLLEEKRSGEKQGREIEVYNFEGGKRKFEGANDLFPIS
jgi:hypothetical protein